jgi:DNA-3-methyladenine glycosylase II
MTPSEYERARRLLMRRDPILREAIKRIGPCLMAERQRKDHLTALVGAIVSQQLSTKAAATIFGRFQALFAGAGLEGDAQRPVPAAIPNAAAIDAITDQQLRAVGFSSQKIGYLRDLCARIANGSLDLDALDALPDEEVIERLVAVRGFGRWTAEMFLMFRLHRPDVLPVDDLGILNAVQRLYRMRKRPNADRVRKLGEAWKPYRSVASWYLWQTLRNEPLTRAADTRPRSRSTSRAR